MKRHWIVLCILLTVSLMTLFAAAISLGNDQEDVVFTQQTITGDPAAAEGWTVTVHAQMDNRLFWTSRCDLAGAKADTDFTYGSSSAEAPAQMHRGVEFSKAIWSDYFYDENGDPLGYAKAMEQLLNDLPEGEERLVWYRLQEHFTYYPICWSTLQIDLPVKDPYTLRSSLQEVAEVFHSYFRIPVLDEAYTLQCTKNDWGYSVSRNLNDLPSGDSFDFICLNAVTDSACYFTFSNRSNGNAIVDTSNIPGGYGIYCLPYSADHSKVDTANLSAVYSLDPSVRVVELSTTKDQQYLLLTTLENDQCKLRIIEIAGMKDAAEFVLCKWDETLPPQTQLVCSEDYIYCNITGRGIAVIDKDFSLRLTADITHEGSLLESAVVKYAFDGSKLLMVYPCQEQYMDFSVEGCGFYVAVYDSTGLIYHGKYSSSLDVASNQILFELWNTCTLNKESEQLEISVNP